MGRPKGDKLDQIRTRAWFLAVSRTSGLSAYGIEEKLKDGSKAWHSYKNGKHRPNDGLVKRVEDIWPGTRRFLELGPANLFASARVESADEAFGLFLSKNLESRFVGVLPRYQRATSFRGSSAQSLVRCAEWLANIALADRTYLPLAVSVGLSAARFWEGEALRSIILQGAEEFRKEYGMKLADLVDVHDELLFAYHDSCIAEKMALPTDIADRSRTFVDVWAASETARRARIEGKATKSN